MNTNAHPLKKVFLLFFLIWFHSFSVAQEADKINIEVLTVGDTIDRAILDISLKDIVQKEELETIDPKWIIIDFWATWCPACLATMPKMLNLKEQFSEILNIVFVTSENRETVNKAYSRNVIGKEVLNATIANDSVFRNIFPHRVIPHLVIIDPQGVVKAITNAEDITEMNIRKLLEGADLQFRLKYENMNFDMKKVSSQKDSSNFMYRSVITRFDPSAPYKGFLNRGASDIKVDSINYKKIKAVHYSNFRPLHLYYSIYMIWKNRGDGNINPYRIDINISDSLIMKQYANPNFKIPFSPLFPYMHWENREDYVKDNYYSYELNLPEFVPDSLVFEYMFNDFNRFFPIKGEVKKKEVECLVLYIIDETRAKQKLKPKDEIKVADMTDHSIVIKNYSMAILLRQLNMFFSRPIVNETGIKGDIEIEIDFEDSEYLDKSYGMVANMLTFDEKVFKEQMFKYGIGVKKESRSVDILFITD